MEFVVLRPIKQKVELILNIDVGFFFCLFNCLFSAISAIVYMLRDSFKAECHSLSWTMLWVMQLLLVNVFTSFAFLTQVRNIFQRTYGEVVTLCPPGEEDRRNFFSDLLLVQVAKAPPRLRNAGTSLEPETLLRARS